MINIDFPSNGIQLCFYTAQLNKTDHDDVIKWKHFPRYRPFLRGIHRSTVNSPHKGQWRGPLMFSLICTRINGWVNNREAGDLRRHHAHYDVTVMRMQSLDVIVKGMVLKLTRNDYVWKTQWFGSMIRAGWYNYAIVYVIIKISPLSSKLWRDFRRISISE